MGLIPEQTPLTFGADTNKGMGQGSEQGIRHRFWWKRHKVYLEGWRLWVSTKWDCWALAEVYGLHSVILAFVNILFVRISSLSNTEALRSVSSNLSLHFDWKWIICLDYVYQWFNSCGSVRFICSCFFHIARLWGKVFFGWCTSQHSSVYSNNRGNNIIRNNPTIFWRNLQQSL